MSDLRVNVPADIHFSTAGGKLPPGAFTDQRRIGSGRGPEAVSFRLLGVLVLLAAAWPVVAQEPAPDKWAKSIAAFDEQDQKSPPPKDAVLFVGSSSIRLWDTAKAFPNLPTINRGFGGSQMSDAARHAKRLINAYKPRVIVLYEGDNDLGAKKTPEQVAADFDALLKVVRADLPTTPLVVIGCKPSPSRWKLIDKQRALNRLLAARCEQDGHAVLVDVVPPMLGSDGQPKPELYRMDKLHMTEEGYKIWRSLVGPAIQKAMAP